jgi:hypothetical protein
MFRNGSISQISKKYVKHINACGLLCCTAARMVKNGKVSILQRKSYGYCVYKEMMLRAASSVGCWHVDNLLC